LILCKTTQNQQVTLQCDKVEIDMLQILATTILPILGGYLLSKVDPIATLFSPYLQKSWQLPVMLSLVLLLCALIPYRYQLKKSEKIDSTTEHRSIPDTLRLSPNHISILRVFRKNDGELISAPLIEHHTGLEIIVINSILADFEKYNLIHATNLDEFEGGWQYQLSDKGRKTALKFT
jgi:hypothetical protein